MIRLAGAAMCLAVAAGAAAQSARERVIIQQVVAVPPSLTFYVDVTDPAGLPVAELALQQVTIRGPGEVQIQSVRRLVPNDGIAYIVLVDISRSLASRQEEMREALQRWISEMTSSDQMAIVTFGNSVQTRQDFTSSQSDLTAASSLTLSDQNTHLYAAFKRAAELARRLDPGLPTRRVVVVLSDGKNDEHETGLTEDDAVREVATEGLPVFSVDVSKGSKGAEVHCSATLARISTVSNGLCERLGNRSIGEMFDSMRAAIRRVLVIDVRCNNCPADGVPREYWMAVRIASTVQRSSARLVAINPSSFVRPIPMPVPVAEKTHWMRWSAILIALSVFGGFAYWLWLRKRGSQKFDEGPGQRPIQVPAVPVPQKPNAILEFVVIGGAHSGKRYEVPLHERLSLGRGQNCQVRIDEDDDVAEAQCEFAWIDNAVYVRDLATESPTMVGGARVRVARPIDDRETIRVGRTELRILIKDARTVSA